MSDTNFLFYITTSIVIMLCFALGVILFFYRSQKKVQQEKLKTQQIKISFQQQLLEKTVETQEKERDRIARELHDDIGSKLNIVHLNLHLLRSYIKKGKDINLLLKDIQTALSDSIETSRTISHELVPPTLRKFGLESAIEDLQLAINNTGQIQLIVEHTTDWQIREELHQLHVYRILQELVQNALKHSKATEIYLIFTKQKDHLHLLYKDNGIGIPSNVSVAGLGMNNISTRIQILQGEWNINHNTEQGAEIKISIPL